MTSGTPVSDSPDSPNGRDSLLATDLHVQATYRLTEALAESENRMRRRIELLSEIVFETDPAGALIFLNGAWHKAMGHPIEACMGRLLSNFAHKEDRAILESAMKGPPAPQSVGRPQIRFVRADAGIEWMEISATQLADGGAVGVLHDVTQVKQAQDELAKVSLVASFTDDLVIITDRDGRTEWVNQAFTRRTGFTLADMAGRKPGELLQGPDTDPRAVEHIRAQLAEGRSFDAELLNYTRQGEPYWVSLHISPIRDKEGRLERFVAIQSDATERRATQMELKTAKERAEKMAEAAEAANRAKSEFLATMSHEIRTPMNGILGMTELLLLTRLEARQRELTETVSQSGKALLRIINDILDFSKIEAGQMTMAQAPFELRPLIEDVVSLVSQTGGGKPVAVRGECSPLVPAGLVGDAGRLRQILLNLMGNGLKFTSDGSVVTRVRLIEKNGERVRLRFEVADTGVGIAPDKIALLFRPFQQVDSSPERRYGGTGLGLAISGRLVELMGGRIGVESTLGSGSMFWFEIEMLAVAEAVPSSDSPSAAGLRVLVARDHALNRRLSLLSLEKLGCSTSTAETGAEVLNSLDKEPYDAVLFDQRLADMDGLGLAKAIRESEKSGKLYGRPRLRLVSLVSGDATAIRAEILAGGIDATLTDVTSLASLRQSLLGPAS